MKGQFCFCDAGLPAEPYAQRYEIITRCCEFLDGNPFGEPEYRICRARYVGNGVWNEIDDIDCNINSSDERSGFALVSAGMSVQFDRNPEYFEIGGNADLKRGMDVVAWYPFPALPDLSVLKPMEVN